MIDFKLIDIDSITGAALSVFGTVYYMEYVQEAEKTIVFLLTCGAAITTIIYNFKKIKNKKNERE